VVIRDIAVGMHQVRHRQAITPLDGGGVHVAEEAVVPVGLDDLPRVGTVLGLVAGLEQAEWFGLGPHESYADRKRSAMVGRWRSTVSDLFTPYVRPQEAGGRADVRWLDLRDTCGQGVRLTMDEPRQVSATHHAAAELATATHHEELMPRPDVVVHIDAAQRGLGTASCGPDTTEPYLLGPGTYRWSWTLQPI
jgi:beta-galactosidase